MTTAFDLIGHDGPEHVRIVGGRTLYEVVGHQTRPYEGGNVRLARLAVGERGLKQINRYVHPDTPVELVSADRGDTR